MLLGLAVVGILIGVMTSGIRIRSTFKHGRIMVYLRRSLNRPSLTMHRLCDGGEGGVRDESEFNGCRSV